MSSKDNFSLFVLVVYFRLSLLYRFYNFLIGFRVFVSDLYGVNVRPVAPFGSVSRKPYFDPALIHRSLPDELLFEVLHFNKKLLLLVIYFNFLIQFSIHIS